MYGASGVTGNRPVPPSAGTAKTLIVIALVLQFIGSIVLLLVAFFLGSLFAVAGLRGLGALFIGLGFAVLFVAILAYHFCYRPVAEGRYADARTPTLVLGIISLFAGGLLLGILYLIAWDKLGDALREQQLPMIPQMGYIPVAVPVPFPGAPGTAPPPPAPPIASAAPFAPAPTCPRCHNPGSWVAQYGRFYCYTCQQYV
ncbi:MAG: hypothetical protein L3K19_02025 [Thermoplasmata archaeon]|nr:hypothetical protein [Thermoplasmata archaeon]